MPEILCHANAVAVDGRGVLIRGRSGSGKSGLSLQLMSLGANLVSDDQTRIILENGALWAEAPVAIAGLIEARGVGILRVSHTRAAIVLVIDLDQIETHRFPAPHSVTLLDQRLPCLYKAENPAWPAAILQYLKGSRRDPE